MRVSVVSVKGVTMDLTGRTVWQVGTGGDRRSYDDICLKHEVVMIGPGEPGPVEEDPAGFEKYEGAESEIEWFYQEIEFGDVIILRSNSRTVEAVGVVADETAEHRDLFADVDGWDLQHSRRVQWLHVPEGDQQFGRNTFRGTLSKSKKDEVHEWLRALDVDVEPDPGSLSELPDPGEEIEIEDLARRLFVEGMPGEYVNDLVDQLAALRRVADWYENEEKRPKGRPSESETVAYLVVPLLKALGWSEQTAAIEWNRIDVALFDEMPPTADSLRTVIEVKPLKHSVRKPYGQARSYAEEAGREGCDTLITTDGIRYAVFQRDDEGFYEEPNSYLNVGDMRSEYPVLGDQCAGAVRTIIQLSRM